VRRPAAECKEPLVVTLGMVVLGLASFAAMLAFVKLCDLV
jgi:hypothetical protein